MPQKVYMVYLLATRQGFVKPNDEASGKGTHRI